MGRKITQDEFLQKCYEVHKSKNYDFSKAVYNGNKNYVTVICLNKNILGEEHGEFQIQARHLMNGHGCPFCVHRHLTTEEWVAMAKEVHGDKYDYSLIEYKNKQREIGRFICHQKNADGSEHGVFEQQFVSHLQGNGCPKCNKGVRFTKDQFLKLASAKHNNKYSYEKFEYVNARTKGIIICPEHGEFLQAPYEHVNRGQGCPTCANNGKKPKECGFWNNKENCFEEAKKYRNKFELMKKAYGCYNSMWKNGWLDEAHDLFYSDTIHYMGNNEQINIVYAYIMEETKSVYIGRTNNLTRRDRQHRNGENHSDGSKTYDTLYKHCIDNHIDIPQPLILDNNLTLEESQIKEGEWVEIYIKENWQVLNIAPTGKGKGSIGFVLKWTYEKCKEEAEKYKTKNQFKENSPSAYNSAYRHKWLDEFFITTKKPNHYWENLDNLKEEAKKYRNRKDFSLRGGGAYNIARKLGYLDQLIFNQDTY